MHLLSTQTDTTYLLKDIVAQLELTTNHMSHNIVLLLFGVCFVLDPPWGQESYCAHDDDSKERDQKESD